MKRIIASGVAVVLAVFCLIGCASAKPKVTVQVEQNGEITLEKSFDSYGDDIDTLEKLVVEYNEELGASYEDSDYGKFVTGMNGYIADSSANEYFEILVNGESSMVGMAEIPLNENDVYLFKLSTF